MSRLRIIDAPITWAVAGFAVGFGLGVNLASVWLVAIGMGAFVAYLALHGDARRETEGRLFLAGPAFIIAWIVGFSARGILF